MDDNGHMRYLMCMETYRDRKAARVAHFQRFVFGWRLRTCGACAGSGVYDNFGQPTCGGCEGTGKERVKAPSRTKSSTTEIAS